MFVFLVLPVQMRILGAKKARIWNCFHCSSVILRSTKWKNEGEKTELNSK